jgi:hypothetical protein
MARSITSVTTEVGRAADETAWRRIARLHQADWLLDERSISLIKRHNPQLSHKDMLRMINKFQESVGVDTVRNEYLMRPTLYSWMMSDRTRADLETFNNSVYSNLFLTPSSDQWLGLLPSDVYIAVDNGGARNPE